ncbi:MAG: methyltransferase domain-containing protein [Patescibacteria group bacterium]
MDKKFKSLADYNIDIHSSKGLGGWRILYKLFLNKLNFDSIIEIGAGPPTFLSEIKCLRRIAIDGGDRWKKEYNELGIDFFKIDLDKDELPNLGKVDIAVCSDVFEHLIFPDRTLFYIHKIIKDDGILFSHVPNEFSLWKTFSVMMGKSDSMYFHKFCEEYNDPHLHRFTKIGFEKFLKKEFKYNLFIGDMKYHFTAKILGKLRLKVPYMIEGGPTFVSTNDSNKFNLLKKIKLTLN